MEDVIVLLEYPVLHFIKRLIPRSDHVYYANLFISFIVTSCYSFFYFPILFIFSTILYAFIRSKFHSTFNLLIIWTIFLIFFNFTSFSTKKIQFFFQFLFYRTFTISVTSEQNKKTTPQINPVPNFLNYTTYTLTIFGLFSGFFISYHNFMLLLYNKTRFEFSKQCLTLAILYIIFTYMFSTLKEYIFTLTLLCTLFAVIRRIISWKLDELSIRESTIYDISNINKRDIENFTLERVSKSEGISDWYSNYGYTLTIFWGRYFKNPLRLTNKIVMQCIIQLVNGNNFMGFLFIPELLGMMYVDRLLKVEKLKKTQKYNKLMKVIGYLQGLYISTNSLTNSSISSFIHLRRSTFFFYPLLSIVSLIISRFEFPN